MLYLYNSYKQNILEQGTRNTSNLGRLIRLFICLRELEKIESSSVSLATFLSDAVRTVAALTSINLLVTISSIISNFQVRRIFLQ